MSENAFFYRNRERRFFIVSLCIEMEETSSCIKKIEIIKRFRRR